jgi:hypothetical protein
VHFGQDAQAQKSTVNLSCGKSCSGSISIGNTYGSKVHFLLFVDVEGIGLEKEANNDSISLNFLC